MTTGVDLARGAVKLFGEVHPGESLSQQCQRLTGYYTQWVYQGNETGIIRYGSAREAAEASVIFSTDINAGQPGDFAYWKIDAEWHVAQGVGHDLNDRNRALVTFATARGDVVLDLGNFVKVSHADTYDAEFYGWSHTNGHNPRMSISAWDIQPSHPSQPDQGGGYVGDLRKVKGDGVTYYEPVNHLAQRIGYGLNAFGRNRAPGLVNDGDPGVNWRKGVQRTIKKVGYVGAVDGKLGSKSLYYVQVYAQRFGGYKGPLDRDPGAFSWEGFAKGLETP